MQKKLPNLNNEEKKKNDYAVSFIILLICIHRVFLKFFFILFSLDKNLSLGLEFGIFHCLVQIYALNTSFKKTILPGRLAHNIFFQEKFYMIKKILKNLKKYLRLEY